MSSADRHHSRAIGSSAPDFDHSRVTIELRKSTFKAIQPFALEMAFMSDLGGLFQPCAWYDGFSSRAVVEETGCGRPRDSSGFGLPLGHLRCKRLEGRA